MGHGASSAPWPNRLRDGRYAYAGTGSQVDISEPPTNTALHGLVMWQRWQVVAVGVRGGDARAASRAERRLPVRPAPGGDLPARRRRPEGDGPRDEPRLADGSVRHRLPPVALPR